VSEATVFLIQSAISGIVFALVGFWYVSPWIARLPVNQAMTILLTPHLFHHVGIVTLVPSVVGSNLPAEFAWTVAIGDSAVLISALISMGLLRRRSRLAVIFLWIFTAIGVVYNSYAGWLGIKFGDAITSNLGPHWYVGVMYVPLLLVSHLFVFINLIRRRAELKVLSPSTI